MINIHYRITLTSNHRNQIKHVIYDKHSIIDQSSEFQETFVKQRMVSCLIECFTFIFYRLQNYVAIATILFKSFLKVKSALTSGN